MKLNYTIANILASPTVQRYAAAAAKNAAKAIRAVVDSWNSDSTRDGISDRGRFGWAVYHLGKEEAIKGTLTQRTARALAEADRYVAETRAMRVWGYIMDFKAVECLTSENLRDIVRTIRACEDESDTQLTRDINEQLCNELMELADQKEDMDPEEAIKFGQPQAEEIFRRRFCAEAAAATDSAE